MNDGKAPDCLVYILKQEHGKPPIVIIIGPQVTKADEAMALTETKSLLLVVRVGSEELNGELCLPPFLEETQERHASAVCVAPELESVTD